MGRIKVSSAKAKGRWLQDWVCKRISEITGFSWGHEDEHLIKPRPMGQKGTDVILIGEALEAFPFSVECKSGQSIGWQAAVRQARANKRPGTDWLVVLKTKEFKSPVIMMDAKRYFERLVKEEE